MKFMQLREETTPFSGRNDPTPGEVVVGEEVEGEATVEVVGGLVGDEGDDEGNEGEGGQKVVRRPR